MRCSYDANGPSLSMNNWHHLVGVREGDYIRFYVNGTLANSTFVGSASINNVANQHMLLGRTGAGNYTNAGFDELSIYNRALSVAEVGELFGLGCGDFDVAGEALVEGYRYGFNGKEKDDEVSGKGNQYDYGFRIYNPRLGRFLSTDPLFKSYPWYTPYQFAGNMPIWAIDLDGLEEKIVTDYGYRIDAIYAISQQVADNVDIANLQQEVNAAFNGNSSQKIDGDLQKYLPDLISNDGKSKVTVPSEVRVQFKIEIVKVQPDDINMQDLSRSRLATKTGQSLGGTIVMGDPNDPAWLVDENGIVASAYHQGETITLNPSFFDKSYDGYHGYGPINNGDGTTTTYQGSGNLTIAHEIGHDLGLKHAPGKYPAKGNMSNDGDRIPTSKEIEIIKADDNERVIQPGQKND